jgi:hypothetical protein
MIITDLPCLAVISDQDEVIGGKQIKFHGFKFKKFRGNKSVARTFAYAEGNNVSASYRTSVYLDGDVSKIQSSSQSFAHS